MSARAYKFELNTKDTDVFQYARGIHLTRLFNSLSLLFPVGEKFFCQAIRHYEPLVPELREEIKLFYREEAQHSMQHKKLNDLLKASGYDVDGLEKATRLKLKMLGDNPEINLIITVCLEIFTQYGADLLLMIDKIVLRENSASEMWRWHGREEAGHGHRTIAHDVLKRVHPISNIKLAFYFILCMIILAVQIGENYVELSKF